MPGEIPAALIGRVEEAMGGVKLANAQEPKVELIAWLKNIHNNPGRMPALDQLAREVAWALVESNFPDMHDDQEKIAQAIKYLNALPDNAAINLDITQLIDKNSRVTKKRFLDGHYLVYPSPEGEHQYLLTSSKNWNIKAIVNNAPVVYTSLYPLYQAALNEALSKQPQTAASLEIIRTLSESLKLENTKVRPFIQQRKERVVALRLYDSAAEFPAMNNFWQEYEKIYQAQAQVSAHALPEGNVVAPASTVAPIENNNFAATFAQFKLIALQSTPIVHNDPVVVLEQTAERRIAQDSMHTLVQEYEHTVTASDEVTQKLQIREFLKNRKNTDKVGGYTNAPFSPENLFCARLARSLVGNSNSREFWQLLYPNLKSVFLGDSDNDWPEYGEALLCDSNPEFIINYRKVAVMSQHHDARAVILGEDLSGSATDNILVESINKHPNYVALSESDKNHIKNFNPADADFWLVQSRLGAEMSKILGKEIPNFLIFFRELLEVYTRYGYQAIPGEGRRADVRPEYDTPALNSPAAGQMLNGLSPFLQVFALPAFRKRLEQLRDEFSANSQPYKSAQYLLDRETMESIGTCFNQQYRDTSFIVGDPKHPEHKAGQAEIIARLENITLASSKYSVWGGIVTNSHDTRPAVNYDQTFTSIIAQVQNPILLLDLHQRVNNFPDKILAERFLALTDHLPMHDLWNVLATLLPKPEFVQLLFPIGVPAGRMNSSDDCRWALKLYDQYPNISGRDLLVEKTLEVMRAKTDLKHYTEPANRLDAVTPLIRLLIENYYTNDPNQIEFLKSIALPPNVNRLAIFLSSFTGDSFQRVLTLFETQLYRSINGTRNLTLLLNNFDNDATRQGALINFFFNAIQKDNSSVVSNDLQGLIDKLEAAPCADMIARLANQPASSQRSQSYPERFTYLGTLLYKITDVNKFAIVLLTLIQISTNNAATATEGANDFFDMRLDTMLAKKNQLGEFIAQLNSNQAMAAFQILAPTLSDFIKILANNPNSQEKILSTYRNYAALIGTLDDYISVLKVLANDARVSTVLSRFAPSGFVNTPAAFVKLMQEVPSGVLLNKILATLKLADFCKDFNDVIAVLAQLNSAQMDAFFLKYPVSQWVTDPKNLFGIEGLADPVFNKIMQQLKFSTITKANVSEYFSQKDSAKTIVAKITSLPTISERIAFINVKDLSDVTGSSKRIAALLGGVTLENCNNNPADFIQVSKAIIVRAELTKLRQEARILLNFSTLPDGQFKEVLSALNIPSQVLNNKTDLQCLTNSDNFVEKIKTLNQGGDRVLLMAYTDFPKMLTSLESWQKILAVLSPQECEVVFKAHALTPLVKSVDDLAILLKDLSHEQCDAALKQVSLSMQTLDDWISVFQKLTPTQARAVATQFKFKETQFPSDVSSASQGKRKITIKEEREKIASLTGKLKILCAALNPAQLEAAISSLYYDIYYLTESVDAFNILNWSPKGSEADEIAKVSNLLSAMVNFNASLVNEFQKVGDGDRVRQLITVMFSQPYLISRLGGHQAVVGMKGFNDIFNKIFLKETVIDDATNKIWKSFALEAILKNNIATVERLNNFIATATPNEVRTVLEIIQRVKPELDITQLSAHTHFEDNHENLLILNEVVNSNSVSTPPAKQEAIVSRLAATAPQINRSLATNKLMLEYYIRVGNEDGVASVLADAFAQKQTLDHKVTLAQFEGFHQVFNKGYLFDQKDTRGANCIRYYFNQLSPADKTSALVSRLNTKTYSNLNSGDKQTLAAGLAENRNQGDGKLFAQALNQLMGTRFEHKGLETVGKLVAPYVQSNTFFTTKSSKSIAIAKVIDQFIKDKNGQPLTQEDKVTLYVLMSPYMTDSQHQNRTLYNRLLSYYNGLKQDIGFMQRDTSPPGYVLCCAANNAKLQADSQAYANALNGGKINPTSAASTTSTILNSESSAASITSTQQSSSSASGSYYSPK